MAAQLEAIRTQFEGEEFTVHIIGFAKIVGDISDGAQSVVWFFLIALVITAILLIPVFEISLVNGVAVGLFTGCRHLADGNPEPDGLQPGSDEYPDTLPDFCHWCQSWCAENQCLEGGKRIWWPHTGLLVVKRGSSLEDVPRRSPMHGSRETIKKLLAPGVIALVSDTIGFLTILFISIRIIQELAITASIGVAVIILTNLLLLPVLLSWVKLKNPDRYRDPHDAKCCQEISAV